MKKLLTFLTVLLILSAGRAPAAEVAASVQATLGTQTVAVAGSCDYSLQPSAFATQGYDKTKGARVVIFTPSTPGARLKVLYSDRKSVV